MKTRNTRTPEKVKFGESNSGRKSKNRTRKMKSNNSSLSVRNMEKSISKALIKQFIESNIESFGFYPDDHIIRIELGADWDKLPDLLPLRVKFKKEQEVQVIQHNNG